MSRSGRADKAQNESKEVWIYDNDEPEEHEPWNFPQVFIGMRADQIPSLADNEPPVETTARMSSEFSKRRETIPLVVGTQSPQLRPTGTQSQDLTSTSFPLDSFQDITAVTKYGEYIIHYKKKPNIYRPVAVFSGNINTCKLLHNALEEGLNIVKGDGVLEIKLVDDKDMATMREVAAIRHSPNLITISPQNESQAFIYGERSGGIVFGSDSIIQIVGTLIECSNGRMNTMGGGTHTVEPHSGAVKVVICDNQELLLFTENTGNIIDDESYLDHIPGEDQMLSISTQIPIRELHPKPSSRQMVRTTEITRAKFDTFYGNTHSTAKEYIIYYYRTNPDIYRPVAILKGHILGQTLCNEFQDFAQNGGIIRIVLMDTKDGEMISDKAQIEQSEDTVKIQPTHEAICYIYGEKYGGFVFDSNSELLLKGKYFYFKNGKLTPHKTGGEQKIEREAKDMKLVLCGNDMIVEVVH